MPTDPDSVAEVISKLEQIIETTRAEILRQLSTTKEELQQQHRDTKEELQQQIDRQFNPAWQLSNTATQDIKKFQDDILGVKTWNSIIRYIGAFSITGVLAVIGIYANIEYNFTHTMQSQVQNISEQSTRNDQSIADMKSILGKHDDRMFLQQREQRLDTSKRN